MKHRKSPSHLHHHRIFSKTVRNRTKPRAAAYQSVCTAPQRPQQTSMRRYLVAAEVPEVQESTGPATLVPVVEYQYLCVLGASRSHHPPLPNAGSPRGAHSRIDRAIHVPAALGTPSNQVMSQPIPCRRRRTAAVAGRPKTLSCTGGDKYLQRRLSSSVPVLLVNPDCTAVRTRLRTHAQATADAAPGCTTPQGEGSKVIL